MDQEGRRPLNSPEKQFLGLIPARGGSKGIPRKNLIPLLGKPLIVYTFEAAKRTKSLGRVILTTEDNEIAAFGRRYGIEVPFMRPARLAEDDTPMIEVITHCLEELCAEGYRPDYVVLLQPTSPLRTSAHIEGAIERARSSRADTVVSVEQVPHRFTPGSLMRLGPKGNMVFYLKRKMVLRRQDKPLFYARNGPAILIVRREVIEDGKLYGKKVYPFEMGRAESIDIDDSVDLILAESLLITLKRLQKI
jgi:CMP-N-acetylneuraminic acid synthetase